MIVVLDLDRTLNQLHPGWIRSVRELAPVDLRRENGRGLWDWLTEHLSCTDYPVNRDALEVIRVMRHAASLIVVNTGRPEGARMATERWLGRYFAVDCVLMRSAGDYRPTAEVKRANLARAGFQRRVKGEASFAIEDSVPALRMYRAAGLAPLWAPQCWESLKRVIGRGTVAEALMNCVWGSLGPARPVHTIMSNSEATGKKLR